MAGLAQGQPPSSIELRLDSDPAAIAPARRALETFAHACGFDPTTCDEIGLCVNEALANIIRHAYCGHAGRPIVVTAAFREGGMEIAFRDWGHGRMPAPRPREARDPLEPGGIGMVCLRELMDAMEFVPQADGMLLVLRRGLGPRKLRRLA